MTHSTYRKAVLSSVDLIMKSSGMTLGEIADALETVIDEAGLQLVPKEPSEDMLRAYYQCMIGTHPKAAMNPDKYLVHNLKARKRWFAMLAAARGPTK